MTNLLLLLQNANSEYNRGNLPAAKKYTDELLRAFESRSLTPENPLAMSYLNALTLAQSIATRCHDLISYEHYEPLVKEWMLSLLGESAHSYYGLHLTDACECYVSAGDTAKAQQLLLQAMSILEEENGTCPLLNLLYYYHTAKIHFQMNQYHQCIDAALTANSNWLESPLIPNDATPFLQQFASNGSLIAKTGCSNLVMLACAYGKINTPENGILILNELLAEPIEDYYFKISVEITLTELYTRAGEYEKARKLYQKYKSMNLTDYPDLATSLATLAVTLETPDSVSDYPVFTPEFDGQLSNSFCYSQDAFQILLYNRGLKMIADEQYSQALTLYHQLGNRGLSLRLYLLAKTGEYASIPTVKEKADHYFDQEIRSLFLYYNEKLVYNHLSLLEYHFSLCMDAYVTCLEHLGTGAMPPHTIYDFLLNTKYISLEASYLSRHYQTLEALNNRQAFTSSDIQNCIPADTAVLEYCIIQNIETSYYCVFLITMDSVTCIRLGEQKVIDDLLAKWHDLMQTSIHASALDTAAHEHDKKQTDSLLRRYLFRPIKEALADTNINNLMIAPAGGLIHFPFSQLPISSDSYLGDRYKITYVNTGKELITNPSLAKSCVDSALVLGNPNFVHFKPLPYAEQEAMTAAEALHANCFTGNEASLSLFESCLSAAPSLLHLATHGVFYEKNTVSEHEDFNTAYELMDNSGLVLSEDNLLSCNMITCMNFSDTFLTVLSACQTGKGLFHSSEGVYGLRRAFRLAGCHSMILSLWQVDDHSGCLFMQYFYKYLLTENLSAKDSFFLAISDLKQYEENGSSPFAHPYYWAGYIFME